MNNWSSNFTQLGQAVISKVKLGTVLDGPLALAVVVVIICSSVFVMTKEILFAYLAFAPVILFATGFVYFMIKDPNKLRSEEHEQTMVRLSSGLGESTKKEISEERLEALPAMTNPKLTRSNERKKK